MAPMSGITDFPFREVARKYGVGMTVSEMVASSAQLRDSKKSKLRRVLPNEQGITVVQLLGNDPTAIAEAARYNVDMGASIIDINMGCPAKKVLKKAAGSALLADEKLVGQILDAVVGAVDVPVTLKIRTGLDKNSINAHTIARIAEQAGIQSLAVHGRTRACKFNGNAEHETSKQLKQTVSLPIVANGDIDTLEKAASIKTYTAADAIMVGRGALGRPWFLQQLSEYLKNPSTKIMQQSLTTPSLVEQSDTCLWHMEMLYDHYGIYSGVRIGRKHIRWYLLELVANIPALKLGLKKINSLQEPGAIISAVTNIYRALESEVAMTA